MIITRTPFRITLGGGGTDLPSFYQKHGGFIFAMGIDKYMYIITNPPGVDNRIRLRYSQTEVVDHVSELKHDLAREALRLHGIENKLEIDSMADIPAGTGVGSSSAYLVGLLSALHSYRREPISLQKLAEEACHIELDVLKKGIGKQDQYMAVYGGLTTLEIDTNGIVTVKDVALRESAVSTLINHTHMYYTGIVRNTLEVLDHQNAAMKSTGDNHNRVENSLLRIKDLGYEILDAIQNEEFDKWGLLLHKHWEHKKQMSQDITHTKIDALYEEVRTRFGVLGGKIVGAGGGGFLMLYTPNNGRELEDFMQQQGMPRLHYHLEREGSKVISNMSSTHYPRNTP